jgi:hypothetical protein
MKKNEKNTCFAIKKMYFLYCFFLLVIWFCISKMFSRAREDALITFKSLKMEKN